jgi:hypothetical protein
VSPSEEQGFHKPQGYVGKGMEGQGQGQTFYTLEKPLPLTEGKGFARVAQGLLEVNNSFFINVKYVSFSLSCLFFKFNDINLFVILVVCFYKFN